MSDYNCVPLAVVQEFTRKYPKLWGSLAQLRTEAMAGELISWDFDRTYCPIAAALAALEEYLPERRDAASVAGVATGLGAWRQSKMIYRFDEVLANELMSDTEDTAIPIDILMSMPAPAIYIQIVGVTEPDGVMAWIEHDVNTGERELRLDAFGTVNGLPRAHSASYIHLIPGGTVSDGITRAEKIIKDNMPDTPDAQRLYEAGLDYFRKSLGAVLGYVQLLLYICAENAEITENAEQNKIYRRSSHITDRFRELRKWDVGVKTGLILRAAERRQQAENIQPEPVEETEKRTYNRIHRNRPHIRHSHWHHFWTGPKDGERKLILRWMPPIPVNIADGELPVTIIPKK